MLLAHVEFLLAVAVNGFQRLSPQIKVGASTEQNIPVAQASLVLRHLCHAPVTTSFVWCPEQFYIALDRLTYPAISAWGLTVVWHHPFAQCYCTVSGMGSWAERSQAVPCLKHCFRGTPHRTLHNIILHVYTPICCNAKICWLCLVRDITSGLSVNKWVPVCKHLSAPLKVNRTPVEHAASEPARRSMPGATRSAMVHWRFNSELSMEPCCSGGS